MLHVVIEPIFGSDHENINNLFELIHDQHFSERQSFELCHIYPNSYDNFNEI